MLLGTGASALLPEVVPHEPIGRANALSRLLREVLRIVAPAFGAAALAVAPYGALIAVVAVVCAGAGLWLLSGRERTEMLSAT